MTDLLIRRPHLSPAPDPNPPYDSADSLWHRAPALPQARGQGMLALEFVLPSGAPARPAVEPSGRSDLERWSRMLAQAFAETLNGTRPPAQLRFWVTKNVHRRLLLAVRLAGLSRGCEYKVPAVHIRTPMPGVVEVVATLRAARHAHAMAFRIEARRDQWLCTALEVGFAPRPR